MVGKVVKKLIPVLFIVISFLGGLVLEQEYVNDKLLEAYDLADSFTQLYFPESIYRQSDQKVLDNLVESARTMDLNLVFRTSNMGATILSGGVVDYTQNIEHVKFYPMINNGTSNFTRQADLLQNANALQDELIFSINEFSLLDDLYTTSIFVEHSNQEELQNFINTFLNLSGHSFQSIQYDDYIINESQKTEPLIGRSVNEFNILLLSFIFVILYTLLWLLNALTKIRLYIAEGFSSIQLFYLLCVKPFFSSFCIITLIMSILFRIVLFKYLLINIGIVCAYYIISFAFIVAIYSISWKRKRSLYFETRFFLSVIHCLKFIVFGVAVTIFIPLGNYLAMDFQTAKTDSLSNEYGVFFPMYIGNDYQNLVLNGITAHIVEDTELYRKLEKEGMLLIDSQSYRYNPDSINQMITVNPNYLEKFSIVSSEDKPIQIATEDTNKILLIPERNLTYLQSYRDYYSVIFESNEIDFYIMKDGQTFPTLNPMDPQIDDPNLVMIQTQGNSISYQRQFITGGGFEDPVKVKIDIDVAQTYSALKPYLTKSKLADNLTSLATLSQVKKMMFEITLGNLFFNLAAAVTVGLLFVLMILCTLILYFQIHYKKLMLLRIEGTSKYRVYRSLYVSLICQYTLGSLILLKLSPSITTIIMLTLFLMIELTLLHIILRMLETNYLSKYLKGE